MEIESREGALKEDGKSEGQVVKACREERTQALAVHDMWLE